MVDDGYSFLAGGQCFAKSLRLFIGGLLAVHVSNVSKLILQVANFACVTRGESRKLGVCVCLLCGGTVPVKHRGRGNLEPC